MAILGVLWWQERPLATAEAALENDDKDKALRLVNAFLREHPRHGRATALKARVMVALEQWAEAIQLFERFGVANDRELHDWARALLHQEEWAQASPMLERLLQNDPKNAELLHEISACRARLGFVRPALESAKQLAKLPGCEVRGNLLIGMFHRDLYNNEPAAEAWRKVLQKNPNAEGLQLSPEDFFLQFGLILMDLGHPKQALEQLQRSIARRETAKAHSAAGLVHSQLGHPKLAIAAWQKAVALDTENREAREALARQALVHGNPRDAIEWLTPIQSDENLKASTAYLLQRAYTTLKDQPSAREWQKKAKTLREKERLEATVKRATLMSPESFWSRVIRAYQFAEEGNWQTAEDLVDGLMREHSKEPFLRDLADAIRNRGRLPSLDRLPMEQF